MDLASNEVALERPWILKAFDRVPLPYPITCLILGILINYQWLFEEISFYPALAFANIIYTSYLIAGIPFLGNMMERIFEQINLLNNKESRVDRMLMNRFLHSRKYFYIFLSMLILIRLLAYEWSAAFSSDLFSLSSLHFKSAQIPINEMIFNLIESLIMAYVLWIALNISWSFSDLKRKSSIFLDKIDVYELYSSLNPLRENIYKVFFYYLILSLFLSFSFMLISYYFYKQFGISIISTILRLTGLGLIFYTIFILFSVAYGAIFFILGLKSLSDASRSRIEYELRGLNKLYKKNFSKFRLLVTSDNGNVRSEDIDVISKSLQTLREERDSIMKIKTEGNIFAAVTFFVITIVPPIVALLTLLKSMYPPHS